ncbi:Hly-III family protein [Jannaschia pagri]|uniref:Hly-III family protein n=1 Tax=Jannaschia pagri TaxID=2829797 RepID=A0ABQ4NM58_9RHOB|nr:MULTISPECIES: hemolysin III family protein [unclassified Jannaschia]GIT91664.1 Hly-III family protein [Jannaschia sp. AI_61]GIT95498.1 Hly-III family protein [Jannaschia sp. AI_62]
MTDIDPRLSAPSQVRSYDRAELLSDALVHLAGLVLALAAVPVLITLTAVWRGDFAGVAAVSVYGATLIAMLSASLAYNHIYRPEWSEALRKLDMSAIYLKIAGTVTPFALLSGTGATFLAAMWSAAGLATVTVFLRRRRSSVISVGIGLAMGWAVLIGGGDVIAATTWPVFALMIAGGVLYSLGTPFLLLERLRFHNTIWHGFVVVASIVYFVAITWHLAVTSLA